MSPKVVLITGTSSGLGLATAIGAARSGWHTVATLRDLGGAQSLRSAAQEAGVELDVRQLDVTDESSTSRTIAEVIADHGRLDAVINNAGIGFIGTLEQGTLDDVRTVMEVDFFGVLRVSRAAMPHLRASCGRLITVTSVGGVMGQPFNEAYCAAKFAVEGYMESLAPVAARLGVTVCLVEPAGIASDFTKNLRLAPAAAIAAAGPYGSVLRAFLSRSAEQFADSTQSPAQAAEAVLRAINDRSVPLRLQTSDWARDFSAVKLADLDGSAVLARTRGYVEDSSGRIVPSA